MFVDTYLVIKQAKFENFDLSKTQIDLLNEIDSKQGLREPWTIETQVVIYERNHIWRLIQSTQRGIIVVDNYDAYNSYKEKILIGDLVKKQFYYNTFIFNYNITEETYNDKVYSRLHEEIQAGNKCAIFAHRGLFYNG